MYQSSFGLFKIKSNSEITIELRHWRKLKYIHSLNIGTVYSQHNVLMNTSFVLLSGLGDYLGLIDVVEEFSSWTYILTFVLGGGGACWTMTVVYRRRKKFIIYIGL